MWRPPTLIEHYDYTTVVHQPTALVMKISLLAGLFLVAKEPGVLSRRLLALVFAAHFLGSAYLALGSGGGSVLMMLACLALVVAAAPGGFSENPPEWRVVPEDQPLKAVAIVALVVLAVFPFWPAWPETVGPIRRVFFAPAGTLPHLTLGVLLLVIALGGTRHRGGLSATAILAALLIGLLDVFWAYRGIGALLMAGAIVTAFRVYPRELAGTILSPGTGDEPRREKEREVRQEEKESDRPAKQSGKSARKWDL